MKVARAYLDFVVEPAVRRFCGPLFFTTAIHSMHGHIHANGSFGLIDTGQKRLLVTCNHVLAEFVELRKSKPALQLGLCLDMKNPVAINPEDFLVDSDRRCDLATFDMDSLLSVCEAGNLGFYNLHANRPPKVEVGDVLYAIGFPGKGRVESNKGIGFPRQPFGVQATQVGQSSFFSECSNLKLHSDDFAGISGCPCFVVRDPKPIRLVGFATGFSDEGNLLQFTYAHYIKPDGVIKYTA